MKTPANDNDHITSTAASPAVWLAEGQSSQRDMLASLQTLKNHADTPFNIIASHRHNRPEIFEFADSVYREPSTSTADNDEQTVLESVEPLMPRWPSHRTSSCWISTCLKYRVRRSVGA